MGFGEALVLRSARRLLSVGVAVAGLVALALVCAGAVSGTPYSEGHRDGALQKFTRKGILRRSHEGELALPGLAVRASDGTLSNVWAFSVEDHEEEVIRALDAVRAGRNVRLHYRQHLLYNPFRHATGYRVYKVDALD